MIDATISAPAAAPAHAPIAAAGPDWADRILDTVLSLALLGELVVLFGSVVARSLFAYSFLWSNEVAQICLTVLAFIGGPLAYRRGQHMAVQVLVDRLPAYLRPTVAAFGHWLVVALSVAGGALSVPVLISRWAQRSSVMGVRETWLSLPLVIGLVLLAIFALERLWRLPSRTALGAGAAVGAAAALLELAQAVTGPWPGAVVLWLTFGLFALMLAIAVPIGFVLPMVSLVYLYGSHAAPALALPQIMQSGVSSFILLAVPFFILAGYIMTEGGLTRPLADFVCACVAHLRGGLLQVIIVSMYIFSGISGAKVADVAAVGTTMNDMLREQGYPPAESVAVLTSAAIMGETVPPSVAMLVLGSITSLSVAALFAAGLLPAAVMALCLMALAYVRARIYHLQPGPRVTWAARGRATVRAVPALLVPIILIGGILLGLATPTEVSSFAVVYSLLLSAFVYRKLDGRGFWRLLAQTATMAGMILFIVSTATAFSWSLTLANIPNAIAAALGALGGSSVLFLVTSVVALVIMGALLEGLPALLIFGPLLIPVAQRFGINPLQYAIVLIFAMGMGFFAPPLGVGLYVSCSVGGASMEQATRRLLPYLLVLGLGLLLVAFVPWFSLVLPNLLNLGR